MSDDVQPGVRIDGSLWQEFRNDIKERNGGVRGHLRTELENAIRQYIRTNGTATHEQLNQRLERIEAAVGAAPTDGGEAPTSSDGGHTHTRQPVTEKPAANAATEKKIRYLTTALKESHGGEFEQTTRERIIGVVKEEYGFRADTAKRYVTELIDHMDLREHPNTDKVLMTEQQYEEFVTERLENDD